MENHEKWMELCALASKEQDPAKLLALTQEIARLLEEKEQRLKGQLPATAESSGYLFKATRYCQAELFRKEKRWQPERKTGIQLSGNRNVNPFCQIEYVSSDSDVGSLPCGHCGLSAD